MHSPFSAYVHEPLPEDQILHKVFYNERPILIIEHFGPSEFASLMGLDVPHVCIRYEVLGFVMGSAVYGCDSGIFECSKLELIVDNYERHDIAKQLGTSLKMNNISFWGDHSFSRPPVFQLKRSSFSC